MVRQILVSPPRDASAAADAPDLGRWLTRELRVKGTPLPSQPPPSAPPGAQVGEAGGLAGWFTRDLIPKNSVRPSGALVLRALPPSDDLAGGDPGAPSAPSSWNGAEFASEAQSEAADAPASESPSERSRLRTTQPLPVHTLPRTTEPLPTRPLAASAEPASSEPFASEPASADVVLAQGPAPSALVTLEDDDLSVLPGRRRAAGGARRAKLAVGLMLGLVLLGVGLVVRLGGEPSSDPREGETGGPATEAAVLLPPPPSSDALLAAPADVAAASPVIHRRAAGSEEPEEPEGLMDPRDPRFRLGGPSVRRYADVPSPTLSRLAQEQRRLAREREQALRNAKTKKSER